jgi:hypothetical protein
VPEGKTITTRCTGSYRISKNYLKMTIVKSISYTRQIEFTIKNKAQTKNNKNKRDKLLLIIKQKKLNKYKEVM